MRLVVGPLRGIHYYRLRILVGDGCLCPTLVLKNTPPFSREFERLLVG